MARKPNHAYEKRQRELKKKARRDEKRERKRLAKEAEAEGNPLVSEEVVAERP